MQRVHRNGVESRPRNGVGKIDDQAIRPGNYLRPRCKWRAALNLEFKVVAAIQDVDALNRRGNRVAGLGRSQGTERDASRRERTAKAGDFETRMHDGGAGLLTVILAARGSGASHFGTGFVLDVPFCWMSGFQSSIRPNPAVMFRRRLKVA